MKAFWKLVIIIAIVLASLFAYNKLKTKPIPKNQETASINILEKENDKFSDNSAETEKLPEENTSNINSKNEENNPEKADIPDLDAFEGLEDELEEIDLNL
ncbi:MAG: hypothetical protein WCX99_01535, partial [Candidatus Paceibacterota bacterium]